MELSIGREDLFRYINSQLSHFFPDNIKMEGEEVWRAFDHALEKIERCFVSINNPMYSDEKGHTFFSHLHSDQYAQFIYFFQIAYGICQAISPYVIN